MMLPAWLKTVGRRMEAGVSRIYSFYAWSSLLLAIFLMWGAVKSYERLPEDAQQAAMPGMGLAMAAVMLLAAKYWSDVSRAEHLEEDTDAA